MKTLKLYLLPIFGIVAVVIGLASISYGTIGSSISLTPTTLSVKIGDPVSFSASVTAGATVSLIVPDLNNSTSVLAGNTRTVSGTAAQPGVYTVNASGFNPSTNQILGPVIGTLNVQDTLTLTMLSGTVKNVAGHGQVGKPGSFTYYANAGSSSTSVTINVLDLEYL